MMLGEARIQDRAERPLGQIRCLGFDSAASLEEHRLRRVEDAFASLPERYLGADPGFERRATGSSSRTSG